MPYYRPISRSDHARPPHALSLAGGWCWFDWVEVLERGMDARLMPASDLPPDVAMRLSATRAPIATLDMSAPQIMGILNVTPDSFSDGGEHADPAKAIAHALIMTGEGATILDVGGESTRPGAAPVPHAEEIARTAPIIAALRDALETPISIDTRKASVARAAHEAGANLINDVAGFTFDIDLAPYAAAHDLPVCVMHAQGTPEKMQRAPRYDNVLLDIYDWLSERITALEALGIPRTRIVTDPGIGFGKTQAHNLALLQGLSLFHGLGCPILLGASRKRFIGDITQTPNATDRMPGSLAVALAGVAQGVQILRVHDVPQTRAALQVWQAITFARPC